MHALLARGWPDLSATVDVATRGCLTLLADMGGPDAVRAHPTAARQALGRGSSGRLSREKVETVLHSAQQAHGRLLTRGETQALQALAADALHGVRQLPQGKVFG